MNKPPSQNPFIDELRAVPLDARDLISEGRYAKREIPYGQLCHQAANELQQTHETAARMIARLQAENDALMADLQEANGRRFERILLWLFCGSVALALLAFAWKFWR